MKIRTTIELNQNDKERLQEIAKGFGILRGRGIGADDGSISGLMQAIASGEVILKKENQ